MATAPSFAASPRSIDKVSVSAANTNRDGTGTIPTIATGSAAGFKILSIIAKAEVTTTAGMIRIFISTDSGTSWDLFDEMEVTAIIVGTTVASCRVQRNYENLVLMGTTNRLGVTLEKAETFNVFCLGADL